MMKMGEKLAKHPQIHAEPAKALIETFLVVHEGLNDLNDEAAFYSGCTAVVMLIRCGDIMLSSFPLMILSILRPPALRFSPCLFGVSMYSPGTKKCGLPTLETAVRYYARKQ